MKTCSINNCESKIKAVGLCSKHYQRQANHGDPLLTKIREPRTGTIRKDGYLYYQFKEGAGLAHVLIAEKALGKKLPPGAVVHHADGNPSNNKNSNLVICPSQAYHMLIHARTRAYEKRQNK